MLTKKNKNLISEEQTAEQSQKTAGWKDILKLCIIYGALIGIILFVFNHILMLNLIPSGSMENTIMPGDMVISTRFDRTDIQRYDIMVFKPTDETDADYYIKRVIGLPGETILIKDGNIYVGHELLDDSFLPETEKLNRSGDGLYEVPEGCYFMLGDNRSHSQDARYWDNKYVPLENMAAKAKITIFPLSHAGSLGYHGAGNTAAPAGEGLHSWTAVQESNTDLVLNCRECGQQHHLEQLQVTEEPDGSCARHPVAVTEEGHAQAGGNGVDWIVDSLSLQCKECGWSATAIPND